MDKWELQIVTNAVSLVSSADVQAARARARSLSSARNAVENSAENKNLSWEADHQRLENIREPLRGSYRDAYGIHSRRTSSPTTTSMQLIKGHHRAALTPRPAYRRSLHAANCELLSFREKFDQWRSTYDREISKTKATLASMTPTLQGLALAARIHKIVGKAAESLNSTPSKTETPPPSSTVASTPREDTLCEASIMESSLQRLQLDTDLLSITDDYPDFLDDEVPLSERAGKLAAVEEDIGVLTTIIEKKIFATHISNFVRADAADVAQEDVAVDLCGWSEGAPTARTIKMADGEDSDLPRPADQELDLPGPADQEHDLPCPADQELDFPRPVDNDRELDTAIVEELAKESPPQLTTLDASKYNTGLPRSAEKPNLGIDPDPPKPVNLRDNLIILAQQKGFTNVGTPHGEGCLATTLPSERERAMALLRKMYAPSSPTPPTPAALQSPGTIHQVIPAEICPVDEATVHVPGGENDIHAMGISAVAATGPPNVELDERIYSTAASTVDVETTVPDVSPLDKHESVVRDNRQLILSSYGGDPNEPPVNIFCESLDSRITIQ